MLSLSSAVFAAIVGAALAQSGCPREGTHAFPHESYCDSFYLCVNGTYSEEKCANGLIFTGHGYVHNHCNYNWAGDCGKLVYDDTPISSPGCLYAYGIYPVGEGCQKTFFKCANGVAYETPCPKGQVYNKEYHLCDHPDNVYECQGLSDTVTGFKCPNIEDLPANAVTRRFLPYPRFPDPHNKNGYVICINGNARIQSCGDYSYFDEQTLTCIYEDALDPNYPNYG